MRSIKKVYSTRFDSILFRSVGSTWCGSLLNLPVFYSILLCWVLVHSKAWLSSVYCVGSMILCSTHLVVFCSVALFYLVGFYDMLFCLVLLCRLVLLVLLYSVPLRSASFYLVLLNFPLSYCVLRCWFYC